MGVPVKYCLLLLLAISSTVHGHDLPNDEGRPLYDHSGYQAFFAGSILLNPQIPVFGDKLTCQESHGLYLNNLDGSGQCVHSLHQWLTVGGAYDWCQEKEEREDATCTITLESYVEEYEFVDIYYQKAIRSGGYESNNYIGFGTTWTVIEYRYDDPERPGHKCLYADLVIPHGSEEHCPQPEEPDVIECSGYQIGLDTYDKVITDVKTTLEDSSLSESFELLSNANGVCPVWHLPGFMGVTDGIPINAQCSTTMDQLIYPFISGVLISVSLFFSIKWGLT